MPLLVFVHGLGGNMAQFSPLLTSLINMASCLAIDLPGCGGSAHAPQTDSAYTQSSFAELVAVIIERYRDVQNSQQVILIGHSMGCTTSSLLASSTSPLADLLSDAIVGFVAICPRASPPTQHELDTIRRLRWMPVAIFDVLRLLDRRGGIDSRSVARVVGKGASEETKKLQLRYNARSRSAAFLQIIRATLQPINKDSPTTMNGWPGRQVWEGIKSPLFLVAGEADTVTPAAETEQIVKWLTESKRNSTTLTKADGHGSLRLPPSTDAHREPVPSTVDDPAQDEISAKLHRSCETSNANTAEDVTEIHHSSKHAFAIKTAIFPDPAAHGLMYAASTVRVLSGLIETFLAHHVDERLSPGWQLQHLTTSGKWDVKNLKKWQSIDPCSEPIGGVFRALKTMREVDDVHCPANFVRKFSSSVLPDGVATIVDISHEAPVYDPKGLEVGGVEYHKFPTVSKLPPTPDEVDHFVALVDELRQGPRIAQTSSQGVHPTIGVHCHYGFNRTGMFIVSYLVQRLGYRLQDALDEFAEKRAPGIKHDHFINELYVRHAISMKRRDTIVE